MRGLSLTEIVLYTDADMSILPNTGASTKEKNKDSYPCQREEKRDIPR